MSDESSDSLPSPGFVSVFRNHRLSSPGQGEGGTEGGEAGGGGEADGGGGADRGGEADRGGGDVGEGNIGGGAKNRPLPTGSTAWTMEAVMRSKSAPEPVIEFR